MKDSNLAAIQIIALAISTLTEMQETCNEAIFKYKDGSYSLIGLNDKKVCIEISLFEAALDMGKIIEEAIQKEQAIVLYICPDNALISIEVVDPKEDSESLEFYDKEEIEGYDKFYSTKD